MVARSTKLAVLWQRTGLALRSFILTFGFALVALLIYILRPQEESPFQARNLLVFFLVNLNVVIICVLAFLIGRNLVKLAFDRKRKILGSKLKLKLAVAFVSLSMVPTVFLFFLASGLLNRAMEGWFSSQIESAVVGAVNVAKMHFATQKENTLVRAKRLASDFVVIQQNDSNEYLKEWLEQHRREEKLFGLSVVDEHFKLVLEVHNAAAAIADFQEPEPDLDTLRKALSGESLVLYEEKEASQFVRAYIPTNFQTKKAVLIATTRINPELSAALSTVNESYKEYEQLKLFRMPIKSSLLLTLGMLTGLILFAAIWIGFYIAKELAVPIQRLAEGTRAVAKGNYDFQIRVAGDDEIGMLVQSFNTMTADLKRSREDAQQRGLYIETILANLAVGVVGLDRAGLVTSVNAAAATLLDLNDSSELIGLTLQSRLKPQLLQQLTPLLDLARAQRLEDVGTLVPEKELSMVSNGRELKVICTLGRIVDQEHGDLGTVLLFDDVTELSKAQNIAVWREVARRIAHEIKNPLTPIQLSAQRLLRLISQEGQELAMHECAQTIVENVDSIKRLANEFSNFARMPTAELKPSNLNRLISDVVAPFAENHSDIVFQLIADQRIPEIMLDREQLRRCVINLIDNAIAALSKDESAFARSEGPRIAIKTNFDSKTRSVTFEVSDNGPGIPDEQKTRVFEPYFTTKSGGTGLGLAIVTSIVADHQGSIRVFDNQPRGAKFVVSLPLTLKVQTQRRLAIV